MKTTCVSLVIAALFVVCAAQQPSADAKSGKPEHDEVNGCAQADFSKYGHPLMFPSHDGVAYGVSTKKTDFKGNEGITVYIWLRNYSRPNMVTSACCESTFLFHIQVLDASGNVLKGARNFAERDKWPGGYGCSCSSGLQTIHPGFCGVIDSGTLNRPDTAYFLAPGEYKIVEREKASTGQAKQARRTQERPAVVITVEVRYRQQIAGVKSAYHK